MIIFFLILTFYFFVYNFSVYFLARRYGVRVEKFYVWSDPWFSLFKVQKGETEFGLGWLPLGGYVTLSGMITNPEDDIMPYYFNYLSFFKRILICLSGPTTCLIIGIVFYTFSRDLDLKQIQYILFCIILIFFSYLFILRISPSFNSKTIKGSATENKTNVLYLLLIFIAQICFIYLLSYFIDLKPYRNKKTKVL